MNGVGSDGVLSSTAPDATAGAFAYDGRHAQHTSTPATHAQHGPSGTASASNVSATSRSR